MRCRHRSLLLHLARQLDVDAGVFAAYARRDQTRRAHLAELTRWLGLRAFDRAAFRAMIAWALPLAPTNLRGRVSRSGSPRARPREGQPALLAPPRPAAIVWPSRSPVCGAWLVQPCPPIDPLMAEAGVSGKSWTSTASRVAPISLRPEFHHQPRPAARCPCRDRLRVRVRESCFQRQGRSARAILEETLSGENVHFAFWSSVVRLYEPNTATAHRI